MRVDDVQVERGDVFASRWSDLPVRVKSVLRTPHGTYVDFIPEDGDLRRLSKSDFIKRYKRQTAR